jgi:hypothetical protein
MKERVVKEDTVGKEKRDAQSKRESRDSMGRDVKLK